MSEAPAAPEAPAPEAPAAPAAPPAPTPPIVLGDVPAPPAPAAPEAPAAEGAITYEPTGDTGLDVALSFVGKLGIAADHPAMLATATGDFSLIKAHLATMGDKAQGWEQMVALAEGSYSRSTTAANERNVKVTAAVHGTCPGATPELQAAHWATVQSWASANADPAEKAELNAMFNSGPVGARAAAMMLNGLYANANGTVVTPAAAVKDAGAGSAATTNGPLTTRQYADAVRDLAREIGSSNLPTSPAYAALGRRLAS